MAQPKEPFVGQDIDAYCPRCKLNLDVVVSAVHMGEIKQVQCRTCGNFVEYKPPADMQAKKDQMLKRLMKMQQTKNKGKPVAAAPKPAASPERARWEELTDQVDSRSARPYDKHRLYQAGQFVVHKKLGIGHVESSDPEEMEMIVLFKDGLETLPMNEPVDD
jgi:hypothetical protein